MKIKVNKPDITFNKDNTCNITFKTHKSVADDIEKINSEFLSLEIKEFREARSLSQNSYMWTLINKLAEVLHLGSNDVYRSYVKDYGVKEYILVRTESVETLSKKWSRNGIGWWCDILRKGKIEDTTTVVLYYGSSSYDTKEMSRLIEPIIEDCEHYGIPTLTIDRFSSLHNEND